MNTHTTPKTTKRIRIAVASAAIAVAAVAGIGATAGGAQEPTEAELRAALVEFAQNNGLTGLSPASMAPVGR